jgi:hypothetical protein
MVREDDGERTAAARQRLQEATGAIAESADEEIKRKLTALVKQRRALPRFGLSPSEKKKVAAQRRAIENKEVPLLRKLRKLIGGNAADLWFVMLEGAPIAADLTESDEELRNLEQRMLQGDRQAQALLNRALQRMGPGSYWVVVNVKGRYQPEWRTPWAVLPGTRGMPLTAAGIYARIGHKAQQGLSPSRRSFKAVRVVKARSAEDAVEVATAGDFALAEGRRGSPGGFPIHETDVVRVTEENVPHPYHGHAGGTIYYHVAVLSDRGRSRGGWFKLKTYGDKAKALKAAQYVEGKLGLYKAVEGVRQFLTIPVGTLRSNKDAMYDVLLKSNPALTKYDKDDVWREVERWAKAGGRPKRPFIKAEDLPK